MYQRTILHPKTTGAAAIIMAIGMPNKIPEIRFSKGRTVSTLHIGSSCFGFLNTPVGP